MRSSGMSPILPNKRLDGSFLPQSPLNSGTEVSSTNTQKLTRAMTAKSKKRSPALTDQSKGILHTKKETSEDNKLHNRPSTSAGRMETIHEGSLDDLMSEMDRSSSLLEQADRLLAECNLLTKQKDESAVGIAQENQTEQKAESALEIAQKNQTEFRSALEMIHAKRRSSNKSIGS